MNKVVESLKEDERTPENSDFEYTFPVLICDGTKLRPVKWKISIVSLFNALSFS